MAELQKQPPEGAFIPAHGRGWLKPAPSFKPGNQIGKGNKNHADFKGPRQRQAAYALRKLYPALAEALRTPLPTYRAWWRKRQATLLRDLQGNRQATELRLLSLLMLRLPAERKHRLEGSCHHCDSALQGEALPLFAGGTVSGWVHPHCLLPASRIQLQKARDALAKALEPWK